MSVLDTLGLLKKQVEEELSALEGSAALEALRVRVLGKKSELTALLKGMGQLSAEERPKVGALINEAREWMTEKMNERQA
ncbi:MAG: phenylalanine--tRNA ligase subunit alpha, partial [Clostridia bacterium]